jgi:hypothetical protein
MPARDIYHTQVKNALVKDGWTITFFIAFDPQQEVIVKWKT